MGGHRVPEAEDGGDRGRGAVESPVEPAEGEHARADRHLRVHDHLVEAEAAGRRTVGQRPEHGAVGQRHQQHAQGERALAQAGGPVLQLVEEPAAGDEALDGPADEAEQPELLGGRRIDRQPVGIVGVALGLAHLVGLAVLPHRALAQQPVRREPRPGQQRRCPPGVAEQHGRRRQAGEQLDQARGDEVHADRERRAGHAEVEVAGRGEVGGEVGILEVADAGRVDAGVGEPVVQPRGQPVAQVGPDRLVQRAEHLQRHEHQPHRHQRPCERVAALHRPDEHAHGDGEHGREHAPGHEHGPPQHGQRPVGAGQHREELPLLALSESTDHRCHLSDCGGPGCGQAWTFATRGPAPQTLYTPGVTGNGTGFLPRAGAAGHGGSSALAAPQARRSTAEATRRRGSPASWRSRRSGRTTASRCRTGRRRTAGRPGRRPGRRRGRAAPPPAGVRRRARA